MIYLLINELETFIVAGILALVDAPAYIRDVGSMLGRPIHYLIINQSKSNLLPYYILTGFRVYTLIVVHYYNRPILIYLYSTDIL